MIRGNFGVQKDMYKIEMCNAYSKHMSNISLQAFKITLLLL